MLLSLNPCLKRKINVIQRYDPTVDAYKNEIKYFPKEIEKVFKLSKKHDITSDFNAKFGQWEVENS